MARIRVVLDQVFCIDTEDVTGGDDFYIAGAVSDGSNSEGVLTVPIDINDNQTKPFGLGGGTVFDKIVGDDRILKVALVAFDEDSNKDWSKHGEMVTKIGANVAAGLAAIPNPYTATASVILPLAIAAVGQIMSMDQDDQLGQHLMEFPVGGLPPGEHTQFWSFSGGSWWYSNWKYSVQYRIIKE